MAKVWNADLPLTAIDEAARTFTAEVTGDIWAVVQAPPNLVDGITVTFHVPEVDTDGNPVAWPYADLHVGQTLHLTTRLT